MQKLFPYRKSNKPTARIVPAFSRAASVLLAVSLLLAGCGDSSASSHPEDASQGSAGQAGSDVPGGSAASDDALHYRATEKPLPDPVLYFENDSDNQGKNYLSFMTDAEFAASPCAEAKVTLSLVDSLCADTTVYFLYQIMYRSAKLSSYALSGGMDYVLTDSYLLYVLEPPYEKWQCRTLSAADWKTADADGAATIPFLAGIGGAGSDGVYLYTLDNDILLCGQDGIRRLEGINTDAYSQLPALYSAGETLYVVGSGDPLSDSFSTYDREFQPVLTQNLTHTVSGCISQGSEYLWYGFDAEDHLTVWDRPNGTALFSLGDMVRPFADFRLALANDGQFLLADVSGIWTGSGDAPLEKILSFSELGYDLQELLLVSKAEDSSLTVIASFEGRPYLLTLRQSDHAGKQKVTIVTGMPPKAIDRLISAFNRQNSEYRVVCVNPFESGDIEAYCRQLQLEVSAGGGPDLMESWLLDWEGSIENGYVEPLDDIIEDPSDFWPVLLEDSKKDGFIYSLPDIYQLSFLVVRDSLAGGLDAWNLEQMMEAVQNSPAETLHLEIDSMDIVLEYGLADKGNTQFIDYEAGVSHLTEQPFLDLLAFAKKYGDTMYYTGDRQEEIAGALQDGRLAALYVDLYEIVDFFTAATLFQDQETLIGMPASEGRGIYVHCNQFCLNSSAPSKEGAKAFLRYLMSKEGQLRLLRTEEVRMGFSVRRDVTEQLLDEYQKKALELQKEGILPGGTNKFGILVEEAPFTDEQREQFMALFEEAKPQPWIPSELKAVIREELTPYFDGSCSAEEAAWKLDNRVQLYLDERK